MVRCDIVATVTLSTAPGQGENLLAVDGGAGTLSGNFVCSGSVTGFATTSNGAFRFCGHRALNTHTSQCIAPADQLDSEPWADGIGTYAPIISHVQSDLITIPLNTATCTHGINGHTLLTQAHLELTNFQCKQGNTVIFSAPAGQARAEAASQIVVNPLLDCPPGPNGLKACFNTLTFVGALVAYSTS